MPTTRTITLPSETDTAALAQRFAPMLSAGDVLLLEGDIGAGKTAFSRALIRARLGYDEDVPSPTFTLVQTYEDEVDIWHCDLYRLTHPDEAVELGLEEAFEEAICLIEWPDRLADLAPKTALTLQFKASDEHSVTFAADDNWTARLEAAGV
ncbi:tRNA (adenosine(37)-N6)-threonylcarbamoyltransferase complex ATPase subunit type 1 TsaE [Marivivens aquimaris]|uniref:tRNA (adenosine(37)-N6)-threonylcarbamoyltransferase complex ATPase subunit type 1 TsaE n=1 Tax=Marivivens aquimaris TaxID=2774876 RepID=UPI001882970D|nr:tRNA (adenosine(37)-N6)-threonylcarbamoyltransferase complex ATPase subunit type 1 TsaE [Marivivens aquimaris]